MVPFLIKSTICLFMLYGFYHFFLQHQRMLLFNRFYLIFSLVFSLLIPLIVIPVQTGFALNNSFDRITSATGHFIQAQAIRENSSPLFAWQNLLKITFIIVSSILLMRFVLNISRLTRKIQTCKKVYNQNTSLVLIDEKILPYSFFKYIFVNQADFENGKIEKELLIHEEAHCLQYHSIDVIILEIINVFLWFNPAVWLYRKAIHLNHEYYADDNVLKCSDSTNYYQLLFNLVILNNPNYLASNFKHSLIKNRLIMMTKNRPLQNEILRKIVAISFFLFLGIVFTFSQVNKLKSVPSDNLRITLNQEDKDSNEWWRSIVKEHGIKFDSYTIYENYLILGEKKSKENFETFDNSIAISNDINRYSIYYFKTSTYDMAEKKLKMNDCTTDVYDMKSEKTDPVLSFKHINYTIDFKTHFSTMADTLAN